ncbi:hypothetical protein M446_3932 [Methylobacterium sp. 4-46]|uniref:hypothetical protein n=1 Tax=unclassified Methylobacterium TaxID=2615210 RepID=UPI000165C60A|nr:MULTISPECIES: hypothetical protein [Methylobacterium]ACA18298.1 hypothetical protein M446_3932 [Methylobacterium sp. 4-46]WFT77597.1 hypothetical protein QA634_19975 [Methylobacterium nodulans]
MEDPTGPALDLARRLERACLDHGRKALDLHKAAASAAQARDLYAAQQAYRTAQDSLRLAQETVAEVLAAVSDFLKPLGKDRDPAR